MKPLKQTAAHQRIDAASLDQSDQRVDTIANLKSISVSHPSGPAKQGRPGFTARMLRRGVLTTFSRLSNGLLLLTEGDDEHRFGSDSGENEIVARMRIHSPEFFRRVALGGSLGFAESYIFGEWTSDNPTDVVRLFCRNLQLTDSANRGIVRLVTRLARQWHERQDNSKTGSARNIRAHYDLGNEFYALFLDETMTYSSGVFETPKSTLHEAQVAKIDRLCRRIDLQQNDHLVEIGTGWGSLAIQAAKNFGCRVTTTTISKEQHDFACRRVAEAGLADRVRVLLEDYRDLHGTYDKLISVEMIEAVGYEYFDTFFRKCGTLLKPDGQMAMQGITMSEQRYPRYLKSVDFIQRYIFPGGCLITPGSVLDSVARTTDLRLLHLEDLATHYGQTVRLWRERFFDRIEEVRLQGFSENFIRLWDFYLSYCEAAFTERLVGTVQMHFAKPRCPADGLRPFA